MVWASPLELVASSLFLPDPALAEKGAPGLHPVEWRIPQQFAVGFSPRRDEDWEALQGGANGPWRIVEVNPICLHQVIVSHSKAQPQIAPLPIEAQMRDRSTNGKLASPSVLKYILARQVWIVVGCLVIGDLASPAQPTM